MFSNPSKRIISTLSLAALCVVTFSGCGASPTDLCAHIKEVATKEAGEAAATAATEGCEKRWENAKEMKGIIKYKEKADCVMDATTLEAISDC